MYQVLYRKWRPRVFSDVVGQPHITRTLLSEVREGRLAHAYLFTGSRGTGKTTCAKILSKAINCLNPQNGNPCNECEICRGVDNGTLLDVVEIDAASNRGIDDIRLLRDESNFTPAQATYRVYIIDEVHMLTIEAFNALLKTLEEPPEHVKFILATTEVHKLPSTILSRCQRFDFRRIEPKVIADRLMFIAQQENAVLHEDAALLIARIADGGMRDALSLLDSALSVTGEVTAAVVSDCAGLMGRDAIYDLVRAVAAADTAKCLQLLDSLHNASCDTERLITELTSQFRNFLILKTVRRPEDLIVCTADELALLKTLADLFSAEQILFALNVLTKTGEAIKRTQNRRIEAEMALIRLCSPETDTDVSALNARIASLEAALAALQKNGVPAAPAPAAQAPQPQPAAPPAPAAEPVGPENDISPFDGFDQEEEPSGGYASLFDGEEDDDAPLDKEAFLREYEAQTAENAAAFAAQAAHSSAQPAAPKAEAPKAEAPKPPAASKGAAPAADGPVDKKVWVDVVKDAEGSSGPLRGMLTGSKARITGDVLTITLANPMYLMLIGTEDAAKRINPFLLQYLGRTFEIRFES